MFKKIVCAAIMAALLVSMAVGAAAAEFGAVETTTTTYDATTGDATVTTIVEGVEVGDKVTYVAYKGDVSDSTIAYIDQKTAEDVNVTFEYTVNEEYAGSVVKVGGTKEIGNDASSYTVKDGGTIAEAEVKLSVKIGEAEAVEIDPVLDSTGFTFFEATVGGAELKCEDATVTWIPAASGIWVSNSVLYNQTEVVLTWDGDAIIAESTVALSKVGVREDGAIVALATKNASDTEYGIMLSKLDLAGEVTAIAVDDPSVTTDTLETNAIKYKALGHSTNGEFAVVISGLAADKASLPLYYVQAYSGDAKSDVKTVGTTEN